MSNINDQTESLLHGGLVQPPGDFSNRVMQKVAQYEKASEDDFETNPEADQIVATEQSHATGVSWWQWLILLPGSAIGVTQMMRFVFSMWFVTSAG